MLLSLKYAKLFFLVLSIKLFNIIKRDLKTNFAVNLGKVKENTSTQQNISIGSINLINQFFFWCLNLLSKLSFVAK